MNRLRSLHNRWQRASLCIFHSISLSVPILSKNSASFCIFLSREAGRNLIMVEFKHLECDINSKDCRFSLLRESKKFIIRLLCNDSIFWIASFTNDFVWNNCFDFAFIKFLSKNIVVLKWFVDIFKVLLEVIWIYYKKLFDKYTLNKRYQVKGETEW